MNVSDVKTSKYLKKEDVGRGTLATIQSVTRENIAIEGAEPESRVAVHFKELEKPMILNSTNAQIIAAIAENDADIEIRWRGVRVVLFNDPNVSYMGKITGGIRVRAPKPDAVMPPVTHEENDDLPF